MENLLLKWNGNYQNEKKTAKWKKKLKFTTKFAKKKMNFIFIFQFFFQSKSKCSTPYQNKLNKGWLK